MLSDIKKHQTVEKHQIAMGMNKFGEQIKQQIIHRHKPTTDALKYVQ